MRARWLSTIGLSLGAGMALAQPATARGFTADDLVRMARVSEPQIAPDGKSAVFVLRETDMAAGRGRTDLFTLDLTKANAQPVRLAADPANESNPRWSADGSKVFFLSTRSGSSQVWSVAPTGEALTQVTDLPLDIGGFTVSPSGNRLVYWLDEFRDCVTFQCTKERLEAKPKASGKTFDKLFVRHWDTWANGTRSALYAAPLLDGKATVAPTRLIGALDGDAPTKPFGGAEEVDISPDGKIVAFTLREAGKTEAWSTNLDVFITPMDVSLPPMNLTADNDGMDSQPRFSPDGKRVAFLSMARAGFEADRQVIKIYELSSGQTRVLTSDFDRSFGALEWTPDGRALIASAEDVGKTLLFRIDAASGAVRKVTESGTVGDWSVGAGGRILAARHSLTAPADLYLGAANGTRWSKRTAFNADALKDVSMGQPEQFSFAGANGDTVYGYVVKPANYKPGETYPIAFLIHGGPQGSFGDQFHYRWNAQTYAGAGYGVVMVDFHGSTGYGQAFTDSISQNWGSLPFEDLQKGLAAATQRYTWLDADNACALGGSYGGYMVNWIAGNWPDRFKCLVNHDGIIDTRFMGLATEELWFTEWENGGTVAANPAGYEKFNPIAHIGKWKTPMLVIHGANDFRVPPDQGLATFTALQRQGVESKLLYFPDENHWVLKPNNSVQWHGEVIGWLDAHTKK